jgi:hypothetical protein
VGTPSIALSPANTIALQHNRLECFRQYRNCFNLRLSKDEKRFERSDYVLNKDLVPSGAAAVEDEHKTHVLKVNDGKFELKKFDLDFNEAIPGGPVRPHSLALATVRAESARELVRAKPYLPCTPCRKTSLRTFGAVLPKTRYSIH